MRLSTESGDYEQTAWGFRQSAQQRQHFIMQSETLHHIRRRRQHKNNQRRREAFIIETQMEERKEQTANKRIPQRKKALRVIIILHFSPFACSSAHCKWMNKSLNVEFLI